MFDFQLSNYAINDYQIIAIKLFGTLFVYSILEQTRRVMKKLFTSVLIMLFIVSMASIEAEAQGKRQNKYKKYYKSDVVTYRPIRPAVRVNHYKPYRPYIPHRSAHFRRGHVWIEGHWVYNKRIRSYIWVEGKYVKKRRNLNWIEGRWVRAKHGWRYIPGYWA